VTLPLEPLGTCADYPVGAFVLVAHREDVTYNVPTRWRVVAHTGTELQLARPAQALYTKKTKLVYRTFNLARPLIYERLKVDPNQTGWPDLTVDLGPLFAEA